MDNKLHITKKVGETPQQRRCRVARAMTDLLMQDDELRKEVASILNIHADHLDYMKRRTTHFVDSGEKSIEFEPC